MAETILAAKRILPLGFATTFAGGFRFFGGGGFYCGLCGFGFGCGSCRFGRCGFGGRFSGFFGFGYYRCLFERRGFGVFAAGFTAAFAGAALGAAVLAAFCRTGLRPRSFWERRPYRKRRPFTEPVCVHVFWEQRRRRNRRLFYRTGLRPRFLGPDSLPEGRRFAQLQPVNCSVGFFFMRIQ